MMAPRTNTSPATRRDSTDDEEDDNTRVTASVGEVEMSAEVSYCGGA
jgi:hypothetical protein